MSTQIQIRGDIAVSWTAVNPILADREIAIETDTKRIKIGDGVTHWNNLSYFTGYRDINTATYIEVNNSSSQSISGGSVVTKVTFPTEVQDSLGEFSNSRFTSLSQQVTLVTASFLWPGASSATYRNDNIHIYKNGVEIYRRTITVNSSFTAYTSQISVPVQMAVGDYIEIYASTVDTSARSITRQQLVVCQLY